MNKYLINKKGFGLVQAVSLIILIFFSVLILFFASYNSSQTKVLESATNDFREAYFHTVLITMLQKEVNDKTIADMIINNYPDDVIDKEFENILNNIKLEETGYNFKWSIMVDDKPLNKDRDEDLELCQSIVNKGIHWNEVSGNVVATNVIRNIVTGNLVGLGNGEKIKLPSVSTTLPPNKKITFVYCYAT